MNEQKIEKYVIELENGNFAKFIYERDGNGNNPDSNEIFVCDEKNFDDASLLDKKEADYFLNELIDNEKWVFFGECLEVKSVNRVYLNMKTEQKEGYPFD
ncbi:MAG: hypothetical protein WD512_06615 [Candidatus Paceibacterota bacterium]